MSRHENQLVKTMSVGAKLITQPKNNNRIIKYNQYILKLKETSKNTKKIVDQQRSQLQLDAILGDRRRMW